MPIASGGSVYTGLNGAILYRWPAGHYVHATPEVLESSSREDLLIIKGKQPHPIVRVAYDAKKYISQPSTNAAPRREADLYHSADGKIDLTGYCAASSGQDILQVIWSRATRAFIRLHKPILAVTNDYGFVALLPRDFEVPAPDKKQSIVTIKGRECRFQDVSFLNYFDDKMFVAKQYVTVLVGGNKPTKREQALIDSGILPDYCGPRPSMDPVSVFSSLNHLRS